MWIEKDALSGVFERVCNELSVPLFACKGYTSLSELFETGYRRFASYDEDGQIPYILHFGDHDPSGIDMSRDIVDRVTFLSKSGKPKFDRLALNMNQVDQYQPPPNFAKITDSRARDYIVKFGENSWELDALEPTVLAGLVRDNILAVRNDDLWNKVLDQENEHKLNLSRIADNYDEIAEFLDSR